MATMLFGHLRTMLATLVLLSVPAFAVYSLTQTGLASSPDVELARVVDLPEVANAAPRNAATEELVPGYMFTGGGNNGNHKGKPSPYR